MSMHDLNQAAPIDDTLPHRDVWPSLKRGWRQKCPCCGAGRIYGKFLKVNDVCSNCGTELFHHRADDLPAYLVVVIVGHVVLGAFMGVEATSDWSMWLHIAVWAPLTIVMSLMLLQPIKGAVVGLQWACYMHGFGGETDRVESHPEL